jgi:glycosyltransferase involved in cell wall biosynthesis
MERIIPDVTALPTNPFDSRDIAEKIHLLLKNDKKVEEMGKNARDFIEQNLSWEERAKVYPRIFELVLSGDLEKLNELPLTIDLKSADFL